MSTQLSLKDCGCLDNIAVVRFRPCAAFFGSVRYRKWQKRWQRPFQKLQTLKEVINH